MSHVRSEVFDVYERCRDCGMAVSFVVHHYELDESGEHVTRVTTEDVGHSRRDCARMQELEREQWPMLW